MSKFNRYDVATAPAAGKPFLQTVRKAFGFIPHLLAGMAESPATLEGYLTLSEIYDKSSLSPAERELVLLVVSVENACGYCVAAHTGAVREQGFSGEALTALRSGAALADPRQNALAHFTRAMVKLRGQVRGEELQAFLAAGFSAQQALEVVLGVSLKTLSNYADHLLQSPIDLAFANDRWQE